MIIWCPVSRQTQVSAPLPGAEAEARLPPDCKDPTRGRVSCPLKGLRGPTILVTIHQALKAPSSTHSWCPSWPLDWEDIVGPNPPAEEFGNSTQDSYHSRIVFFRSRTALGSMVFRRATSAPVTSGRVRAFFEPSILVSWSTSVVPAGSHGSNQFGVAFSHPEKVR